MNASTLLRRLDDLRHRMEQQRKKSGNPWFSMPLNVAGIDEQVRECFTPDALVLAEMASTDQGCLVGFLYSAACAEEVPVSEALMLRTLKERAYDLKVASRHQFRLPWDLALRPFAAQNARVTEFLPQVEQFWHGDLNRAGVTCIKDGKLVLAPIFDVIAS